MPNEHQELRECGCVILVYGDGNRPEIVYCHVHNAAEDLRDALLQLKRSYIGPRICSDCGESDSALPDCVNLFATNKALAKAEGKVYDPVS